MVGADHICSGLRIKSGSVQFTFIESRVHLSFKNTVNWIDSIFKESKQV